MPDPMTPARTIGPIRLSPGVVPSQVGVFVTVVVTALCVVVFLPLMQAYVFTEMLHVAKSEQGRLAGNLVTTQQIAVLIFVGLTGALADRLGRKQVLVIAFTGYAVCMFLYPLASSVWMLFVLQFVFGMMTTGQIAGSSTMISDYPENASRGKFVAAMILVQAATSAILVGWVGARLPGWIVGLGYDAATAGRYAFWILGCLAIFSAVVAFAFLKNPPLLIERPKFAAGSLSVRLRTFFGNLKRVIAHGRRNPRFGLIMSMGLVIRSDYFVMLSFVSLWVINAAGTQGVSPVEALKTAGILTLVFKLATAGAQAVFGFVADRFDRSKLLMCALFATGLSLISTLLIGDVFGTGIMVVVAIIGIAESALIVCGQSMLGEEAPVELRGSAVGIFYFTGTLGVVLMSLIAGMLFDKIGYAAPFVMVGLLNLAFGVVGTLMILRRDDGRIDASPEIPHVR